MKILTQLDQAIGKRLIATRDVGSSEIHFLFEDDAVLCLRAEAGQVYSEYTEEPPSIEVGHEFSVGDLKLLKEKVS